MKRIPVTVIVLTVLCLVMCEVLAGCSGNKDVTESDVTEATQAATQSNETVAATEAETTADKADSEKSTLVGTWVYEELSGFTYTFNEDGTGSYDMFGEVMNFTYTDNGDSITMIYEDVDAPSTLSYTIDGDTLVVKDDIGEDVRYVKQ